MFFKQRNQRLVGQACTLCRCIGWHLFCPNKGNSSFLNQKTKLGRGCAGGARSTSPPWCAGRCQGGGDAGPQAHLCRGGRRPVRGDDVVDPARDPEPTEEPPGNSDGHPTVGNPPCKQSTIRVVATALPPFGPTPVDGELARTAGMRGIVSEMALSQ